MTDRKKKRTTMLDALSTAGTPPPTGNMMTTNRALRSARDAVDAHRVWDLDPAQITDERPADRLDPADIHDLRTSIEANGQTVPILVRRDPQNPERYLLVYGGRRLLAIRGSETVTRVRALIATLDDDAALRAQVSENTARRDLSFIERALFAVQLLDNGFGSQVQIAEVLNATKSAVSMAISIGRAIGEDLAQAIGPAHGIGRPRWEALAEDIARARADPDELHRIARNARTSALMSDAETTPDPSAAAFEAVSRHVKRRASAAPRPQASSPTHALLLDGHKAGRLRRTATGVRLDLTPQDAGFADWLEAQAQPLLQEFYDRWKQQS